MRLIGKACRMGRFRKAISAGDLANRRAQAMPGSVTAEWDTDLLRENVLKA
jgi:hypothetical protein